MANAYFRPPPQQLHEIRLLINGSRRPDSIDDVIMMQAPSGLVARSYRPAYYYSTLSGGVAAAGASGGSRPSGTGSAQQRFGMQQKQQYQKNQTASIGTMLANIRNHIALVADPSSPAKIGHRSIPAGGSAGGTTSTLHPALQPLSAAIGAIAGLFVLMTCGVTVATLCSLRRKRNSVSTISTGWPPPTSSSALLHGVTADGRLRRHGDVSFGDLELDELASTLTLTPQLDLPPTDCSQSSHLSILSSRDPSVSTQLVDLENELEARTADRYRQHGGEPLGGRRNSTSDVRNYVSADADSTRPYSCDSGSNMAIGLLNTRLVMPPVADIGLQPAIQGSLRLFHKPFDKRSRSFSSVVSLLSDDECTRSAEAV